MNTPRERDTHWESLMDEQTASGLSRQEFCRRHNIVLSQFTYYYLKSKKKKQKELLGDSAVMPIPIRKEPSSSWGEIKVWLPNGLQISLPCREASHLKQWLEVLKSC